MKHYRRTRSHLGASRPAVRQHHERNDDRRDPIKYYAADFSNFNDLLGLLTGTVQAYIFNVLATVYIAAATRTRQDQRA